MDHVAIMKKSWKLTSKILTSEKKIESRWYKSKYNPWDKINKGDTVYFKDSGEPITIKATVSKVIQFSDLTKDKVKEILDKYGKDDGIPNDQIKNYYEMFKDKKYCLLIFLKHPIKIISFNIDKSGFGVMSAWISVSKIDKIRINSLGKMDIFV